MDCKLFARKGYSSTTLTFLLMPRVNRCLQQHKTDRLETDPELWNSVPRSHYKSLSWIFLSDDKVYVPLWRQEPPLFLFGATHQPRKHRGTTVLMTKFTAKVYPCVWISAKHRNPWNHLPLLIPSSPQWEQNRAHSLWISLLQGSLIKVVQGTLVDMLGQNIMYRRSYETDEKRTGNSTVLSRSHLSLPESKTHLHTLTHTPLSFGRLEPTR